MTATHPFETQNDRRPAFASATHSAAEFLLNCEGQQIYLQMATPVGGVIGLFEMEPIPSSPGSGPTLNLTPGTYRYRYYAKCGRATTYVYPGQVEPAPRPMDGLDAILHISTQVTPRGIEFLNGIKTNNANPSYHGA